MKSFHLPTGFRFQESHFYIGLCLITGFGYLFVALILPAFSKIDSQFQTKLFGFSQFSGWGLYLLLSGIVLPIFAFLCMQCVPKRVTYMISRQTQVFNNVIFRIIFALFMAEVFFLLKNEFINVDALMFTGKFIQEIPVKGAFVTHDEMWEFYLHSRFWFYTHQYLGWTVAFSYQVLSSIAGGIFVFLLLTYWTKLLSINPFIPFFLTISGGYMQLFFGDVENYTLTGGWIIGYFFAAALFLQKKVSVILPSILLAIAITFHLLSLFLVPSLFFLWMKALKREKRKSFYMSMGIFFGIIALTLLFFHLNHLPLKNLWYDSHLFGHGGDVFVNLVTPSLSYYFQIFNLIFLLVPAWILIIPLFAYRKIPLDAINIHLIIASGFMVIFFLTFKAGLGVYQDWNLYACSAIPISLLIWRNMLSMDLQGLKKYAVYYLGWLYFLHSYGWIIANHYYMI